MAGVIPDSGTLVGGTGGGSAPGPTGRSNDMAAATSDNADAPVSG
jgi:hypothetical protein